MKTILIVGSKGYIGKNLIDYIKKNNKKIEFKNDKKRLDIRKKKNWLKFPKADTLIFLAGISSISKSTLNPSKCLDVNINGIINALDYCVSNNANLIFLSSAICKNGNEIINSYHLSKISSENICKMYSKIYKINITILRIFNVYGKNQSSDFLIPNIIKQIESNNKITVKNLDNKRDYIYIEDVCASIISATKKIHKFEIIEIGTGISSSVKKVIDVIQKIKKSNLKIFNKKKISTSEIKNSKANTENAKKILGWQANNSLQVGLSKILK